MSSFRFCALAGLALSVAALSGCATTPTPYQPYVGEGAAGVHGGFSEVRLAPDRMVVRFHGNEYTSRERVEGYLLYRAADVTLQNGYDWFEMADRHTEHDVQTVVTSDPFYRPYFGYPYWRPSWGYYRPSLGWGYWDPYMGSPFWDRGIDVRTIEAFEATAEVVMHKGPVPAGNVQAIDARTAMARLAPTIEMPKPR